MVLTDRLWGIPDQLFWEQRTVIKKDRNYQWPRTLSKLFILLIFSLGVSACAKDVAVNIHASEPPHGFENSGCFGPLDDDRVYFARDSAELTRDSRSTLDKIVVWMIKYQGRFLIEGHTDVQGNQQHNIALGARRADAVRKYLIAVGVNPNNIKSISYGSLRPAVIGSGEAAWNQNRRVVLVLTLSPQTEAKWVRISFAKKECLNSHVLCWHLGFQADRCE